MVGAAYRLVLAVFLPSVLCRSPAQQAGGAPAGGSPGRWMGLPHRRRGRAGHEPAEDGDAVCLAGRLLHPGGSGLRADGPGGFVCGDGRGCRGIIGNRVRPVQRLPPDRYRDGTGHSGVRRHGRDPGRLAPPGGIFPPPSGGGQPTPGPMSPVVRSMRPPPTSAGMPSMRRWPHFCGASSSPCSWRARFSPSPESWPSGACGTSGALDPGSARRPMRA